MISLHSLLYYFTSISLAFSLSSCFYDFLLTFSFMLHLLTLKEGEGWKERMMHPRLCDSGMHPYFCLFDELFIGLLEE
jgi:hypothetical protein